MLWGRVILGKVKSMEKNWEWKRVGSKKGAASVFQREERESCSSLAIESITKRTFLPDVVDETKEKQE